MYRHNHDSPAKRGAVVIKKPWLLNGQVDHSSLSLRSLRLSCELWGPCCHHLPRQPLDAVLKPEPALDITCLDVPAPVTAQLEQTKVLRDWLYADTVVHILIQIITQFYSVKITHLPKCPCFQYLRQSSKVNVKGTRYYINFIMFSDLYFKISFDILRILLYQWSWKKRPWKWFDTCLLAKMSSEASLSSFSWTSLASSLQDSARRSLLLLSTTNITAVTDKISGHRKIIFCAK